MHGMGNYQTAWQRYKNLRNLAILAWVGFLPALHLAKIGARYFSMPALYFTVLIAWVVFLISTGAEVAYWPCPRCGKKFSSKWGYTVGTFARRCVHCGLPKYSDL
jgi:hypothetical protein